MVADLANRKIGNAIRQRGDVDAVEVGVLARDPDDNKTDAPLAVVCDFASPVSPGVLKATRKLAWNFTRSPLLITVEPTRLRAWTCCEPPADDTSLLPDPAEIEEVGGDLSIDTSLAQQAARSLHWIELVSGRFFELRQERFQRDGCADRLLLRNLRDLRKKLIDDPKMRMDVDICHDLLARLVFIQFLFDRKDTNGQAALSAEELQDLHQKGILAAEHTTLDSVLDNYDDTYALFEWLNERFNGDLFPGSGLSQAERQKAWTREKRYVKKKHIKKLAEFVRGTIDMRGRQHLMWREYAFDVIPLEFISSIYEQFVSKKSGTVYTPPHLVDYMLDGVLPWNETEWDLKILDPACGSGVFLVKALQRLVYRWKESHGGTPPEPDDLRQILEKNLLGVDNDPHAVRVASFSLYLAMCDEIDPKRYLSEVDFPSLRGNRIIESDFFRDDRVGFRTDEDAGTYDIVVGNAPWGRDTIKVANVDRWVEEGWEPTHNNIGPLFLPKAAKLAKRDGVVSLLQPSGLLINDSGPANGFRRKLFETFDIDGVVNLSALRFGLFQKAVGPACIIVLAPAPPSGDPFPYTCPKELQTVENSRRMVIEPMDVQWVHPDDAACDVKIWSALFWGGPRDLSLIRRLAGEETLNKLLHRKKIKKRNGINWGKEKQRNEPHIFGRQILDADDFPSRTFLFLDPMRLLKNLKRRVQETASSDYSSFAPPQVFIKQGWQKGTKRFHAAIVTGGPRSKGALCSKSYTNVHTPDWEDRGVLDSICLTFNSRFAVYYLQLTSGRMATYRPEVNVDDLMKVPLACGTNVLDGIKSYGDVDQRVCKLLELSDSERVLIDDLLNYTIEDFRPDPDVVSPGRRPTRLSSGRGETVLRKYCDYFVRVLKAGFGSERRICATVFSEEPGSERLPVRLVAVHLDWKNARTRVAAISSDELRNRLLEFDRKLREGKKGGAFYQRVARHYDTESHGGKRVATVYLIKPDRVRYWTRSMAMRDADEVFADLMTCR